mmetsp:Transcript_66687/g.204001  ORF Transcript_66687/g.204001 Transcript_66687/m.204001 type:complete len:272 (-) Transcript_66687:102-917(-)
MAETGFRWRRASATCRAVSRPLAIEVPPPALSRSAAMFASFLPAPSMRRSRNSRRADVLNVTRLSRSSGRLSSATKRTAPCTRRNFSPLMEPLTSSTQIRSIGWRGSSAAPAAAGGAAAACNVTMPKTSCARPRGKARYSTRASIVKGPAARTSGSGCACEAAAAPAAGAMGSSSWKLSGAGGTASCAAGSHGACIGACHGACTGACTGACMSAGAVACNAMPCGCAACGCAAHGDGAAGDGGLVGDGGASVLTKEPIAVPRCGSGAPLKV